MMKGATNNAKIEKLIEKGVRITSPETITIGEEVSLDRISGNEVTIHSGCKIYGSNTLIMDGCDIGYESPVTIEDCQLGPQVDLKGGFFSQSTFLEKVTFGLGAHVRAGCLLEEEASGAHTVGLKQTILFPFVTLGSLINFCDCFMAGGTSRKNHSEVGSSYIHFNYTPNQDKATPSLIGDVPRGVMLNQKPIFLGGQGGLVGPVRLGYGTVIAAGTIYRKDFPQGDGLLFGGPTSKRHQPLHPELYPSIKRIIANNINYIANIIALEIWYREVRAPLFGVDQMMRVLYEGALEKLAMAVTERIKRLKAVAEKMPQSIDVYKTVMKGNASALQLQLRREFLEQWPQIEGHLQGCSSKRGDAAKRDGFLQLVQQSISENGNDYTSAIKGVGDHASTLGTEWLQGIVDEINSETLKCIPSFHA